MIPMGWFIHEVTRRQRSGRGTDVRATPTWSAQTTLMARVERKATVRRDQQGRDVQCQWRMSLPEDAVPLWDDQWWLPSILGEPADDTTKDDQARSPKSIERATNKTGTAGFHMVYF